MSQHGASSQAQPSTIRVSVEDGVMDLLINRPDRRNALSMAMYGALAAALARASADSAVRLVRIQGAGGSFSSGNDLADFQGNIPGPDGGAIGDFLRALVAFEKPLLAVVRGHAVGIGTTMLLHCDFVLAASDARFSLPFVKLGLVPEAGSSLLLPAMVGQRKAASLLMLGESFDAATAMACGIVGEVLPPEQLQARSVALAQQIVALPTGALQHTKRLMKAPVRQQLEEVMEAEVAVFLERLTSPEAVEAFMAFFEKRAPDFRKGC